MRVIEDYAEALKVVRTCSVVVGLHPDQAAEHLVRFALENRKPFAVVPCCVYSKDFPQRRFADGKTQVRTYQHLLQYLCSLHPNIKQVDLPFEGKNVCLYLESYDR